MKYSLALRDGDLNFFTYFVGLTKFSALTSKMEDALAKKYRDRLRILFIIYFFSEPYVDPENSRYVGILRSEVRIQKLDFLIRYPSYLCYELILKVKDNPSLDRDQIKKIIKHIIESDEPQLRTVEMKKFLYGAWEHLDKKIAFLKAHGLINFTSQIGRDLREHKKEYYLTEFGKQKVESGLAEMPSAAWYSERCGLIKKFFGDLKGTELKALQYRHEEYKEALINQYILDIEQQTKKLFSEEFQESL